MYRTQALELACARWLANEGARIIREDKIFAENSPWLNNMLRGADHAFKALVREVEEGAAAVEDANPQRALEVFSLVAQRIESAKPCTDQRGEKFLMHVQCYKEALEMQYEKKRWEYLTTLWFRMVHSWVRPVKDDSRIEDVFGITDMGLFIMPISLIVGVVIPVFYGEFIPAFLLYSVTSVLFSMNGKFRTYFLGVLAGMVMLCCGIPLCLAVNTSFGFPLVFTFISGVAAGMQAAKEVRRRRRQKWLDAIGVLGCVWVRYLVDSWYEVALVDGSGKIIWRRVLAGWSRHFDGLLGWQLSQDLRVGVRSAGGVAGPGEGWVQCYPSLAYTPTGQWGNVLPCWGQAWKAADGLSQAMAEEFLEKAPLPDGPVWYEKALEDPRPWRKTVWLR